MSDWAISIMFFLVFLIIVFVVMEKGRGGRGRKRRVQTNRGVIFFGWIFLIVVWLVFSCFIGFFPVIIFLVILMAILTIMKKMDKHYYNSIPSKFMRLVMVFIMMIFSFIALALSAFIIPYLIDKLSINIAIVKWFSIFDGNEKVVSANTIFVFIILIFPPAFYAYNFIILVSTSLFERWFSENKIFTDFLKSYDEKMLLANFTIIAVFMGFLPMLAGAMIADEETKNLIDGPPLLFLMLSLLPTANLLFRQAKK